MHLVYKSTSVYIVIGAVYQIMTPVVFLNKDPVFLGERTMKNRNVRNTEHSSDPDPALSSGFNAIKMKMTQCVNNI